MSIGQFGDEEIPDEHETRFRDRLESNEEVRLSWTASNVRWANQWHPAPESPTHFAATDRRILFETRDGVTSIGYEHVRAVRTDPASDGPDLSLAFVACGGLCLLVGIAVATNDLTNGLGLVALSVMLLVAGSAFSGGPEQSTVTIVIDNERQRLSFSTDESVGVELAEFADDA